MVQGMWPYYDKAIGAAIKEAVEPMMDQYKPPGLIKKIYFSKLTFGESPIRIDNVWVEDEGENHVLMEVRGSPRYKAHPWELPCSKLGTHSVIANNWEALHRPVSPPRLIKKFFFNKLPSANGQCLGWRTRG